MSYQTVFVQFRLSKYNAVQTIIYDMLSLNDAFFLRKLMQQINIDVKDLLFIFILFCTNNPPHTVVLSLCLLIHSKIQ